MDGGDQRRTDATESPSINTLMRSALTGDTDDEMVATTARRPAIRAREILCGTVSDYSPSMAGKRLTRRSVCESNRDGRFEVVLEVGRGDGGEVPAEIVSLQWCELGVSPLVELRQT